MASRRLEDLNPQVEQMARTFLAACKIASLDVLVTCTLRSLEEQAELYAIGRTKPGRIVTKAKPGSSAHNYGMAIDVVPMRHGKPVWGTSGNGLDSDPSDDDKDDLELWQRVGKLGQQAGLQWFGAPDSPFPEMPHFQHPHWREIVFKKEVP